MCILWGRKLFFYIYIFLDEFLASAVNSWQIHYNSRGKQAFRMLKASIPIIVSPMSVLMLIALSCTCQMLSTACRVLITYQHRDYANYICLLSGVESANHFFTRFINWRFYTRPAHIFILQQETRLSTYTCLSKASFSKHGVAMNDTKFEDNVATRPLQRKKKRNKKCKQSDTTTFNHPNVFTSTLSLSGGRAGEPSQISNKTCFSCPFPFHQN
jgi:esterase/lipase superfamily enzyme